MQRANIIKPTEQADLLKPEEKVKLVDSYADGIIEKTEDPVPAEKFDDVIE